MTRHAAIVLALFAVAAIGCKKKTSTSSTLPVHTDVGDGDRHDTKPPIDHAPVDAPPDQPPVASDDVVRDPIYFDYDSADLSTDARDRLGALGAWLGRHGAATAVLGGHTDERGTTEYNLALGDRRAQAAKSYLVRLGVAAARVQAISFGEERPAADGADEASWRLNRRVEIDIPAR